MKKKIIIILDSYKYKSKEEQLIKSLEHLCVPTFYYTDYENSLNKRFQGVKVVSNLMSHVSGWAVAFYSALKIFNSRERYDAKLFINPIVGYFYCLLLSVFNRTNENVIVSGFIFEQKRSSLYFELRKKLVSFAYRRTKKLILYSIIEVEQYSQLFPALKDKFTFVKYGRDYDIFEENKYETNDSYFASGGGSNRNYDTLLEAMKILENSNPDIHCKIATRPHDYDVEFKPANLQIYHDIRVDRFGSFIKKSKFVVIPLKDNDISAGHMSLLEAMYQGKAIIVTDIPSVRDYVGDEQVFFYESNNSNELANLIDYIFRNLNDEVVQEKTRASKNAYEQEYGFSPFVKRLVQECD